ncbi:MAG: putative YqhQ protein [Bacteroidetes bacterium]|nr:putative YqhQ protein [Bacteroidota bacterium]
MGNNRFDITRPMQVGGQAVLEGVMMRAPGMVATAVRRADGSIVIRKDPFVSVAERYPICKRPLVRGAVGLVEMLIIGVRTLNYSGEIAMEDLERGERQRRDAAEPQPEGSPGPVSDRARPTTASSSRDKAKLGLTVLVALLAGAGLFFAAPLFAATALFNVEQEPLLFNLVAGGVRMLIFLAYLGSISFLRDVQRLFQYHGAEHKAVFAYEKGEPLDVASATRQVRFHPRCGTSFLLIVMLVSILLFAMLDAMLILWLGPISLVTRLVTHLPLLPLVGGLSYELIRISARHSSTVIGRMIVAPGLWLQKITTKEPDESQLEIALAALRAALGQEDAAPVSQQQIAAIG